MKIIGVRSRLARAAGPRVATYKEQWEEMAMGPTAYECVKGVVGRDPALGKPQQQDLAGWAPGWRACTSTQPNPHVPTFLSFFPLASNPTNLNFPFSVP